MLAINPEKVVEWARGNGLNCILIQSPPGLRLHALKLAEVLRSEGIDAIISGGSCWGGCDVAYQEARAVQADAIIHMGHSRFLERDEIPTYYLECRYVDGSRLLELAEVASRELNGFKKIGVGVTVQWLDHLDAFLGRLRGLGFDAVAGEAIAPSRYKGQVLGCSYRGLLQISRHVDCFLVVGSVFHGLGLALMTPKPVFSGDPELGKVEGLERRVERLLAARYAQVLKFMSAGRVGIIVGVKPGQRRLGLARRLRELLKDSGKEAELIAVDEVHEHVLAELPHEAFVNTTCPRLSIDDQERLRKPLLLPSEALAALGKVKWEELVRSPKYLAMEAP